MNNEGRDKRKLGVHERKAGLVQCQCHLLEKIQVISNSNLTTENNKKLSIRYRYMQVDKK